MVEECSGAFPVGAGVQGSPGPRLPILPPPSTVPLARPTRVEKQTMVATPGMHHPAPRSRRLPSRPVGVRRSLPRHPRWPGPQNSAEQALMLRSILALSATVTSTACNLRSSLQPWKHGQLQSKAQQRKWGQPTGLSCCSLRPCCESLPKTDSPLGHHSGPCLQKSC